MYLHLGQGVVVRQQEIVGVFDMENTTISRFTRSFLNKAEKSGRVTYVSMELPKSYVVCAPRRRGDPADRQRNTVYVSQISPATLRKRSRLMDRLAEDTPDQPNR